MKLQSKINSFFSKPGNALLGSIAFVLAGWIAFIQPELTPKIIGIVTMLCFGFGAIICAWTLIRAKLHKAEDKIRYAVSPSEIVVQKVKVDDEEVDECWRRTGHHFQHVSATRSKGEKFNWSVVLASGEFFREGQNPEYAQAIYDSISTVTGVRETVREDHEHWAVDGDCNGEELARAAAFANDQFLRKYYE